ncbi:transcriptional regulator, LysR family [Lentibacillus halodurans]|uniref:Transcriptional regulator, LysR family n=1 Tax=Lentibacillus halodurans TaxID=237679 RepID=A0A1I0YCX2_9BACI|nr:LysR family transcriptional regulator [Lentibacillus halodurans]SFB10340.1 transcriptional regulator, LysR family [Lentibacillus halodurans]
MNEKDWELLLTLYDKGTITKTAQKLYISQPALTYRINQIEKTFHVKIIHRGNKGVIFTNEGEYLVSYARKMINELRKTEDNLKNMKENVQGILRIGISSNFALYQLPLLLEGFLSKYPNVEISLTTGWSTNILNKLQSEEIHVAIIRGDHNWIGEQLVLKRETLCVASRERIGLDDLPNLNLIRYQTDFHLKNTFDEWWQSRFNVPPNVTMEVDRIETCKELVKKGLGYALFPSISLKKEDNLHTMDLTIDNKKILRETWLLYRKELLDLNVINAFVTFINDYYQL